MNYDFKLRERKDKGVIGIIEGTLVDFDNPEGLVTKHDWIKIMESEEFQERLNTRTLFGCVNLNHHIGVDYSMICMSLESINIVDNKLICSFNLVENKIGFCIKNMLENNYKITIYPVYITSKNDLGGSVLEFSHFYVKYQREEKEEK